MINNGCDKNRQINQNGHERSGAGTFCNDKALRGQTTVREQCSAPPMLCLRETRRRQCMNVKHNKQNN